MSRDHSKRHQARADLLQRNDSEFRPITKIQDRAEGGEGRAAQGQGASAVERNEPHPGFPLPETQRRGDVRGGGEGLAHRDRRAQAAEECTCGQGGGGAGKTEVGKRSA